SEATEKIKGLKSKDIHDLLFERGINLNDVDTWKKRGIGIYKKSGCRTCRETRCARGQSPAAYAAP
ncbi:MAG: hypothetical protein II111_00910, partial [Oscillospiraceae bacterium]|nr:hypothetical protein [Oscillospiraceae bacterium]